MAAVDYHLATPADEADLRALLRNNAMRDWVDLALTREPDFFAASHLFGHEQTIIARERGNSSTSGQAVGLCTYTRHAVHCNGQASTLPYLGALRIAPAWRHRLRIVRQGFAAVRQLCAPPSNPAAPLPLCYTAIASHNQPARRLLEAGLPGLPRYTALNEMVTLALPAARGQKHGLWQPLLANVPNGVSNGSTQRTCAAAAPGPSLFGLCDWYNAQASRYQFAPVLTPDWLHQHSQHKQHVSQPPLRFYTVQQQGHLRACMALWDQRACRQARALHYRWPLGPLLPAYNAWARWAKRPPLPRLGDALAHSFMAFFACEADAPGVLIPLIEDALTLAATPVLSLGLHAQHPALAQLQAHFKPWCYRTRVYAVSDTHPLPLDGRLAQPEVAIL